MCVCVLLWLLWCWQSPMWCVWFLVIAQRDFQLEKITQLTNDDDDSWPSETSDVLQIVWTVRRDVWFWISNGVYMVTIFVYYKGFAIEHVICNNAIFMYKCMHTMTAQATGSVENCFELCQKCLLSNLWLPICFWDFRQSNSIAYSFLRPFWPCWLAMKRTRSAFWTIVIIYFAFGTSVRANLLRVFFP